MPQPVPAGTRVEIRFRLLTPAERALGLPEDTAGLPYDVRARGLLLDDCEQGELARIRTQAGRILEGELDVVEPADLHTFGRPHPALVEAVTAITALKEELR
jgi:hypothetical protein